MRSELLGKAYKALSQPNFSSNPNHTLGSTKVRYLLFPNILPCFCMHPLWKDCILEDFHSFYEPAAIASSSQRTKHHWAPSSVLAPGITAKQDNPHLLRIHILVKIHNTNTMLTVPFWGQRRNQEIFTKQDNNSVFHAKKTKQASKQ